MGEVALQEAFDKAARERLETEDDLEVAQFGGFEGNAQTFRILVYLAARRPVQPRSGLNLTRGTLDAATKYPRFRVHGKTIMDKWGAVREDHARLRRVRRGAGLGPKAPRPFEAELMDWCDDITFAVHDVIDFYRGGFIPLHQLFFFRGRGGQTELSEAAELFLEALAHRDPERWDLGRTSAAWRALATHAEVYDPWYADLEHKALGQAVTTQLITYFVNGVTYTGDAPCRHLGKLVVDQDSDVDQEKRLACDLLKQLLWQYVIEQPQLASHQHGQATIVRHLFEIYAKDGESLLPPDRLEDLEDHGNPLRAASDHVASLTEQEAEVLHQRLTGIRIGAITEAV